MLRIPEALRRRIEVEATKNDRSMNSEIINRLQDSYSGRDQAALVLQIALKAAAEATAEATANTADLLLSYLWDQDGGANEGLREGMKKHLLEIQQQRRESAARGPHEGPYSPAQPKPLGNHPRQPGSRNRKAEA
jgi:hypothetical protein